MFGYHIYLLLQENKLYTEKLQLYFDKKTALKAMVRSIVKHKTSFIINVYSPDKEKDAPLRIHKFIKMKKTSNGHYLFWLKKAFLDYSKDNVCDEPEMFFDTFEDVLEDT